MKWSQRHKGRHYNYNRVDVIKLKVDVLPVVSKLKEQL